jgi:hypothetical protein
VSIRFRVSFEPLEYPRIVSTITDICIIPQPGLQEEKKTKEKQSKRIAVMGGKSSNGGSGGGRLFANYLLKNPESESASTISPRDNCLAELPPNQLGPV